VSHRRLLQSSADADISYADDQFTCFQFADDWRRDNSESAALLCKRLEDTRFYT
jgi:hypothetical protein